VIYKTVELPLNLLGHKKLNINLILFSATIILKMYSNVKIATVTTSIRYNASLVVEDNSGRVSIENVMSDMIIRN
jgi:hypothetical protein